ncbi:hypothetical protein [Senegalia massiliensis]|uniref:Uncharacterized protein n=1 Tax=Senegalia massiliensis TaxID=1720316 RepID=A0A845R2E6_9CLOT|nr:hypothetical protein [Senegalia massiliensis]NBI07602.1 hypothetical protein [Senegalia massiliensis]
MYKQLTTTVSSFLNVNNMLNVILGLLLICLLFIILKKVFYYIYSHVRHIANLFFSINLPDLSKKSKISFKDKGIIKDEKKIKENIKKINDERLGTKVHSYSKEESIKYGFYDEVQNKRPMEIEYKRTKLSGNKHSFEREKLIRKLRKNMIFLYMLYEEQYIKNKTIYVYVEDVVNNRATLNDGTAIYNIDLGAFYDVGGKFVYINLDKEGDEIKVKKIIKDT